MWRISEGKDKDTWNAFLLSQSTQIGIFQQSWEWLEFQESVGRRTHRLIVQSEETPGITALAGLVRLSLPLGKHYWYSPRGPILREASTSDEFVSLFQEIRRHIKKSVINRQTVFWRHEPLANTAPLHRGVSGYGATAPLEATSLKTSSGQYLIAGSEPVEPRQPATTSIIDLTKTDDELFAAMHEKTRYNIRLAAKKGVRITESKPTGLPLEQFLVMLNETATRGGFQSHEIGYYRRMGTSLGTHANKSSVMHVRLFMAYDGEKPIAGALVSFFGDTATYLHGASTYEARQLMGPYLLHWEIIRGSRTAGYKHYDFWGIDLKKWPGVTTFKTRFGGHTVTYPGTFDLPFDTIWYTLYRVAQKIRRM